jgi:NhaP-type Na+/H+ or K+/H+ antiporter
VAAPQGRQIHRDRPETQKVEERKEAEPIMTISIPLVLIVAVIAFIAWRYMGLKAWQAIVCLLLGFLLAATSAAPSIHRIVTGILSSLIGH